MRRTKNTLLSGTGLKVCAILLFFTLPAGGALFYSASQRSLPSTTTREEIAYPAGGFEDGQAQFFQGETLDGSQVRYFIVRAKDGVIRAAFDACDECWRDGKGLYQQGDAMVCRKCEQRFPINEINEDRPGCNPVPLSIRTVDDKVVIEPEKLALGERFFTTGGSGIGGAQCGGGGSCCGGQSKASAKRSCCPS